MAVLDRREGPHHAPRPAAAAQPGQHVVARLAALAGHDADAARQRRPGQALLRLEEALGGQRPAQDLDLGEQVALAGEAQAADGERERRRRRARARVVVRAAGHDDLSAVGQRPRRRRSSSNASRHIEQGTAPSASRSSNHTRARPTRRPRPRRTAARERVFAARRGAWRRTRRRERAPRAGTPRCPRDARADRPFADNLAGAEARPAALQSRRWWPINRMMALPEHRADTVARLTGLLEVTRLVRSEQDLDALLPAIAAAVSEAMGYRTVVISLYRPAWNDFRVETVHGSPEGREALLGRERTWSDWEPLFDLRFESHGCFLLPWDQFDWSADTSVYFVPDIEMADGPDAWHPEDALFVPLRHSAGHMLGILSVDEPVSGCAVRRRPRGARRAGRPRRAGRAGHAGGDRGRAPPHGARAPPARVGAPEPDALDRRDPPGRLRGHPRGAGLQQRLRRADRRRRAARRAARRRRLDDRGGRGVAERRPRNAAAPARPRVRGRGLLPAAQLRGVRAPGHRAPRLRVGAQRQRPAGLGPPLAADPAARPRGRARGVTGPTSPRTA